MAYTSYRSITVDHTLVPSDQTDFPFLFVGTFADLATTAHSGTVTSSLGYDIGFTSDQGGTTYLDWEVEFYDPATGSIVAWVRIPTLSHTTDTVIYLQYGDATITTFQGNVAGVWNSDFQAVWHLNSNTTITDSTSNANTGIPTSIDAITGQIDGGCGFGQPFPAIAVANNISVGTAFTVEAWFLAVSGPTGFRCFITKQSSASNRNYWLGLSQGGGSFGSTNSLICLMSIGGGNQWAVSTGTYADSAWHHVAAVYNGTTLQLFIDGVPDASITPSGAPDTQISATTIGTDPPDSDTFHNDLDEVRVSNVGRSADWIAAEFANQSSPGTFYAVSAAGGGGPTTQTIVPDGIAPSLAFGSPTIANTLQQTISMPGIGTTIAFGSLILAGPLLTPGIAPTMQLGIPRLTTSQNITPPGIAPTMAFGALRVANAQTLSIPGIGPTLAFGSPTLAGGVQVIRPPGIAPTMAVGRIGLTGGAPGWRAFLGKKDCTGKMKIGMTTLSAQAVARWQLSAQMYDNSGSFLPVVGQEFVITEGDVKWFAGVIVEVEIARAPSTSHELLINLTCLDYTSICDRRYVKTKTWPAGMDIADVFRDINLEFLDGEGFSTDGIPATLGPLDSDFSINYDTVGSTYTQLASYAGVVWWSDQNQVLYASGLEDLPPAPFGIDETTANIWRNMKVKFSLIDGNGYRNKQYAYSNLSLSPVTPQRVDTFVLPQAGTPDDFVLGTITLPFPALQILSVVVNGGAPQTAHSGIDDLNFRHNWWYFPGSIYLIPPAAQNDIPSLPSPPDSSPDPALGDTITVTWVPDGANNVTAVEGEALDPSSIVPTGVTPFGALNTIGSGTWEAVATGQDADTQQQLDLLAQSELTRSGGVPVIADFETDRPGLAVGQLLSFSLAGCFAPDKSMLIVSVKGQEMATDDLGWGSAWRWTIQAKTSLDAFGTWVNFYEKLIRRTNLPLPVLKFATLKFALAPGTSLAGGTFAASNDIIGKQPGVLSAMRFACVIPPVDQTLTLQLRVRGQLIPTSLMVMPAGSIIANETLSMQIDTTTSPVYLFQDDTVNVDVTYTVTGPNPTPVGGGTLLVDYQV